MVPTSLYSHTLSVIEHSTHMNVVNQYMSQVIYGSGKVRLNSCGT